MISNVRMLKLTSQEAVIAILSSEENTNIVVDHPALVFAEATPDGGTKISYVPWVPFYKSQKGIRINIDTIVTGRFEEVNEELASKYVQMISPNSIIMPTKKLIV